MAIELFSTFETIILSAFSALLGYFLKNHFDQQKIRFEIREKISNLMAQYIEKNISLYYLINNRTKLSSIKAYYTVRGDKKRSDEYNPKIESLNDEIFEVSREANSLSGNIIGSAKIYLKNRNRIIRKINGNVELTIEKLIENCSTILGAINELNLKTLSEVAHISDLARVDPNFSELDIHNYFEQGTEDFMKKVEDLMGENYLIVGTCKTRL